MSTSRLRIRCRRDGVAMGEPVGNLGQLGGHGMGLKAEDTNVSAPDTIAKLIRGVVFLPETIGTEKVCPDIAR